MKLSVFALGLLIDCGKASRKTKGMLLAPFSEAGTAPWNKFNA